MVSMPYLGDMRHDDFFAAGAVAVDGSATEDGSSHHLGPSLPNVHVTRQRTRQRQHTAPGFFAIESSPSAAAGVSLATGSSVPTAMRQRSAGRKKTNSFMAGLLARRAVGLDLLPSEEAEIGVYEFFARPEDFAEGSSVLTPMPEGWDQGEEGGIGNSVTPATPQLGAVILNVAAPAVCSGKRHSTKSTPLLVI